MRNDCGDYQERVVDRESIVGSERVGSGESTEQHERAKRGGKTPRKAKQGTKMKQPVGYKKNGRMRIAISFDPKLFKEIKAQAELEDKSFSEMASELCKVGLFDLRESDKLEPHPALEREGSHGFEL